MEGAPPSRYSQFMTKKPQRFYTETLCASCWQCQLKIFSSFLRRKSGQRPNDYCHESSHVCTTSIIRSVSGLLACSHGPLELAQSVESFFDSVLFIVTHASTYLCRRLRATGARHLFAWPLNSRRDRWKNTWTWKLLRRRIRDLSSY
jgi:hypothetical protein